MTVEASGPPPTNLPKFERIIDEDEEENIPEIAEDEDEDADDDVEPEIFHESIQPRPSGRARLSRRAPEPRRLRWAGGAAPACSVRVGGVATERRAAPSSALHDLFSLGGEQIPTVPVRGHRHDGDDCHTETGGDEHREDQECHVTRVTHVTMAGKHLP